MIRTDCCIAGGGPAGIMLGYLLARQGLDVLVMEKHADFFRDFRGDTVHPSTLQVLHELGLLEKFLARPHQKTERIGLNVSGKLYEMVDFTHLPTIAKYVAFMPQWDFLDFLAGEAGAYAGFRLMRSTHADELIIEDGTVCGVRASRDGKQIEVRSRLTVACDGRGSTLRPQSGLTLSEKGAPIDVLWFSLPRESHHDANQSLGHMAPGGFLVTINRDTYWQCAFVIEKNGNERIRADGLAAFRAKIAGLAPHLADEAQSIESWDDVKLLSVQVSRLETWWRTGFLAIGDAAHAMSPVGGVGINLALQDAVAAARILHRPLSTGALTDAVLDAVQARRYLPAKLTQDAQIFAHENVLLPAISTTERLRVPLLIRALDAVPVLRRLPARAIGLGPRPEHWPESLGPEA